MPSRAQHARELRRIQQFAKFRMVELNLVPLVDTFVSIVFFSLATATIGEMTPVANGVTLPISQVGSPARQELTLAIGSAPPNITINGHQVMSVQQAALARSDNPGQPLVVPALYSALKASADSIRQLKGTPTDQSVDVPLAIQGDRSMRYDLLSRVLQTARLAGFRNITLQVHRSGGPADAAAPSTT
ncbi:MAG: hypothetical protein JWO05_323 [Gemmatimonadetes bacterium]|nr:hypothetical protein [Gemmatimonadota bacterium]